MLYVSVSPVPILFCFPRKPNELWPSRWLVSGQLGWKRLHEVALLYTVQSKYVGNIQILIAFVRGSALLTFLKISLLADFVHVHFSVEWLQTLAGYTRNKQTGTTILMQMISTCTFQHHIGLIWKQKTHSNSSHWWTSTLSQRRGRAPQPSIT